MTYIKNFEELAINRKRHDALQILNAGYEAIDTEKIIRSKIKINGNILVIEEKEFDLSEYENIYFVGIGKCSLDAGGVLKEMLGDKIKRGIVIDVTEGEIDGMETHVGTHPDPSEENISVGEKIADLLRSATEKDLVLSVISGGGSALLSLPYKIDCEGLIDITKKLTKKGADIYELNTVRKHLSAIKGGNMAKMAHPAKMISLIFSDVPNNDISVIASGPTVRDKTTIKEAEDVLNKYDLWNEDISSFLAETPKEEEWFNNVENFLILTNKDAVVAMEEKAKELGYEIIPGKASVSGEAKSVGEEFAKTDLLPNQVKISAGETTVKISGSGKGGRNQEVTLSALVHLPPNFVFISAASDGRDNSDVAGALCDQEIKVNVEKLHLDPKRFIAENDSYNFFTQTGGHILTGPTGSNVSDLYILLN